MNQSKLWTRNFFAVCAVNLFVSLSFFLLMVTVAVYAMDTFHVSPGAAGLASSIFVIGAIAARVFAGRWMERIGRKKMLYVGLILNLITTLLYFEANSFLLLLIIRFFHGASFGLVNALSATIAANSIPKERLGEGIGYYVSLSSTLSAAIGPFLGMFISQHTNFNVIFIVCVIFAILCFISAFILSVPEVKLTGDELQETKKFKFNTFFETKAIPISAVCMVVYLCHSSVISFLSAYANDIQLAGIGSFFFIVFSIIILISRPFIGRLFDSKGENITMYPAIIIFVIGLIFLSQTNNGYMLMIAGALIGLGIGTIQTSCQTIALKVSPSHHTALATSTFFTAIDTGVGIGPIILGSLIPFIGYRGMYETAAIGVLACLFLYHFLHGKKAMHSKEG